MKVVSNIGEGDLGIQMNAGRSKTKTESEVKKVLNEGGREEFVGPF
jgi:hypothetical protein